MSFALYFLSAVIALFVESLFFQIPITLIVITYVAIFQKKEWVIPFTVFIGILLDSLTFRPIGVTSLFFLCVIGLLYLYKKKFETNHALFGIVFTILACVFYIFVFDYQQIFLATLWSVFLASLLFFGSFFLVSWQSKES